jgi:hypothetical protein
MGAGASRDSAVRGRMSDAVRLATPEHREIYLTEPSSAKGRRLRHVAVQFEVHDCSRPEAAATFREMPRGSRVIDVDVALKLSGSRSDENTSITIRFYQQGPLPAGDASVS